MRESFVSDEIEVVVVVIDEEERLRLGSTEVPGCSFNVSVLSMLAVVEVLEVEVGVVVRGSGTCLSRTWIESATASQPEQSNSTRTGYNASGVSTYSILDVNLALISTSSSNPLSSDAQHYRRFDGYSHLNATVVSSSSILSHPPNSRLDLTDVSSPSISTHFMLISVSVSVSL
jgi:hypothetical protein